VTESKPPDRRRVTRDVEIDFLVCKQCNTPCYVFEMGQGAVADAQCLVCGNEDTSRFDIGDEVGSGDEIAREDD
jgi:hypothetical protein